LALADLDVVLVADASNLGYLCFEFPGQFEGGSTGQSSFAVAILSFICRSEDRIK